MYAFALVGPYIYGLVAILDSTQSSFSSITISTVGVTNVKRTKSILLSKGELCLYIHEGFGTLWKSMEDGSA